MMDLLAFILFYDELSVNQPYDISMMLKQIDPLWWDDSIKIHALQYNLALNEWYSQSSIKNSKR